MVESSADLRLFADSKQLRVNACNNHVQTKIYLNLAHLIITRNYKQLSNLYFLREHLSIGTFIAAVQMETHAKMLKQNRLTARQSKIFNKKGLTTLKLLLMHFLNRAGLFIFYDPCRNLIVIELIRKGH